MQKSAWTLYKQARELLETMPIAECHQQLVYALDRESHLESAALGGKDHSSQLQAHS